MWRSVISICLCTEVKWQWATLVLGWVTVPSSRPATGCVQVGITLCPQTFTNSSALLVSLMAGHGVHVDQRTLRPCCGWILL